MANPDNFFYYYSLGEIPSLCVLYHYIFEEIDLLVLTQCCNPIHNSSFQGDIQIEW